MEKRITQRIIGWIVVLSNLLAFFTSYCAAKFNNKLCDFTAAFFEPFAITLRVLDLSFIVPQDSVLVVVLAWIIAVTISGLGLIAQNGLLTTSFIVLCSLFICIKIFSLILLSLLIRNSPGPELNDVIYFLCLLVIPALYISLIRNIKWVFLK